MGSCATISNKIVKERENHEMANQNAEKEKLNHQFDNIKSEQELLMLREQVMRAKATRAPVLDINSNNLFQKRQGNPIVINSIALRKLRTKDGRNISRLSHT